MGESSDGFAFELDVSGEEETIASAGGELDAAIAKGGLDGSFEIVKVESAVIAAGPGKWAGFAAEEESD